MNHSRLLAALPLIAAVCATPATAAPAKRERAHPLLREIAAAVSAAEQKATITRLVAFGTRHTFSDTTSPTRGIGAARRWVGERFGAMSKECGGCLQIATPEERFTGQRTPKEGGVVQDVLAIQRGTTDPERVIVISGHIDSRVTDVMNATSDAPGANDDGSGVAAVMEAARVLSKHRFAATLVYAVLSGEEQGLYGGKVLANYARAQGWRVEAALNNDIIGNSTGLNGAHVTDRVRVFSEGTKAVETPAEAARRRVTGGEVDSPSRNLARFIEGLAPAANSNFRAQMIYRTDRFGRGGDQTPMLEAGYPGRAHHRSHRELGPPAPGPAPRLRRCDRGRRFRLPRQGDPPERHGAGRPRLRPAAAGGDQGRRALKDDTTLTWTAAPGAASYRVWWRDSLSPRWEHSQAVPLGLTATVKDVVIDDWFFGVQSVSADGWASPIAYPGAAGSFVSPPPAPSTR